MTMKYEHTVAGIKDREQPSSVLPAGGNQLFTLTGILMLLTALFAAAAAGISTWLSLKRYYVEVPKFEYEMRIDLFVYHIRGHVEGTVAATVCWMV